MRLLTLSVVSALLLAAVDADAQATSEIAAMVVDGSSRTRHQALLELLPRPLPARYTQFHDLVPTGWFATLELRPGVFVGPAQPRHEARLTTKASLQLGRRTALVARAVGEAANGGNPNHSALIGSQRGVRGLPTCVSVAYFGLLLDPLLQKRRLTQEVAEHG